MGFNPNLLALSPPLCRPSSAKRCAAQPPPLIPQSSTPYHFLRAPSLIPRDSFPTPPQWHGQGQPYGVCDVERIASPQLLVTLLFSISTTTGIVSITANKKTLAPP